MPNFKFDESIKKGYYLADYFKKTTQILSKQKPNQRITMQWFQRKENVVLSGIQQVLALLRFASPNYQDLQIWTLNDGDLVQGLEPVLKIEGRYQDFGWLEGMIDGILARNSSIATNFALIKQAANGKPVLNMNDRADLYVNQEFDGYSAYVGGCTDFVSEAATSLIADKQVAKPSGTMPHALIQAFSGDVLAATIAFNNEFPNKKLVSLVDYNNDCVTDALKVAHHFGKKLYAVRLDTASNLVDKTVEQNQAKYPQGAKLNGVSEYLVREVREALDAAGYNSVKIIASSDFNVQKITEFENNKVPVDIYGVGSAIAKVNLGFTGDAVLLEGQPEAKFGRKNFSSQRLKKIQ